MTRGQVRFEWNQLRAKLERRDPLRYDQAMGLDMPEVHPVFELIEGGIAGWEKGG